MAVENPKSFDQFVGTEPGMLVASSRVQVEKYTEVLSDYRRDHFRDRVPIPVDVLPSVDEVAA